MYKAILLIFAVTIICWANDASEAIFIEKVKTACADSSIDVLKMLPHDQRKYKHQLDTLRQQFPISMATLDNNWNIRNIKSRNNSIGVLQITAGAVGIIYTVSDADLYSKRWTRMHTAVTILSGLAVVSGILTINIHI